MEQQEIDLLKEKGFDKIHPNVWELKLDNPNFNDPRLIVERGHLGFFTNDCYDNTIYAPLAMTKLTRESVEGYIKTYSTCQA